jgi:hypothetical protein
VESYWRILFWVYHRSNDAVSKLTLELDERDMDIDSLLDIVRTQEQILETLEQILETLNKTSASG